MNHTPSFSAALLALALSGCSDDSAPDSQLDGSVRPDGSTLLDANLGDGSSPDGSAADGGVDKFALSLRQSQCFGFCPAYTVAIDQTGTVSYEGGQCAARPGKYTKSVPAEDARRVYDAFVGANYWSLHERYQSLEDGCADVATDGYTRFFSADVGGQVKKVTRDSGCMGVSSLDKLDALVPTIRSLSTVESLIGDGSVCHGELLTLAGSYKVSSPTSGPRLIKFNEGLQSWVLSSCSDTIGRSGELTREPGRTVLQRAEGLPFSFTTPSVEDVSAIVIESDGAGGLKGTALHSSPSSPDEPLTITAATEC